jgi:hypothetical protein
MEPQKSTQENCLSWVDFCDFENLNEFNVGAWTPLVVTVDELPTPAPTGSSKKQLVYKGMTTEASCRKYLNALAIAFFIEYDFLKNYGKPTMGYVLAAFRGKQGKRQNKINIVGYAEQALKKKCCLISVHQVYLRKSFKEME